MARRPQSKPRYFDDKGDGRFAARKGIPAPLRPYLDNKTEFYDSLGTDRRRALDKLPSFVAEYNRLLNEARHKQSHKDRLERAKTVRADAPMTIDQIARTYYRETVEFDEECRDDPRYAARMLDDWLVKQLREAVAGKASDDELEELVGNDIARFQMRGNTTIERGHPDWRRLARSLAVAMLEAMRRAAERDDGDFTGATKIPQLVVIDVEAAPATPAISILGLLDGYMAELALSQRGAAARKRWQSAFKALVEFVGADDARLITPQKAVAWKDHLLHERKLSPKTVRDVNVAAAKAVFTWGVEQRGELRENPFAGLKVRYTPKPQGRSKGFSESEAVAILEAVSAYQPKVFSNPRNRETAHTIAAKHWIPWLCAHTGSRPREMAQLRKQDVREEGGIPFLAVTPDSGSVKAVTFDTSPCILS